MNWYTYDMKFFQTFRTFIDWFSCTYPVEFESCRHPVYSQQRLLEFFKLHGQPIEIRSSTTRYNMLHVSVGGKVSYISNSEADALKYAVHMAFEHMEQQSDSK